MKNVEIEQSGSQSTTCSFHLLMTLLNPLMSTLKPQIKQWTTKLCGLSDDLPILMRYELLMNCNTRLAK